MGRHLWIGLALLCCIPRSPSGPFGCGEKITCPPPPPLAGDYRPQTSPENVMNNLIVSYRRREIEEYAKILDATFIFRFQVGDAPPELGRNFLTSFEDSTGTARLFNSPAVTDIMIDLTYGEAAPATEMDLLGTMKIRVTPMRLTVDDVHGTTYLVEGDIQDMFFDHGEGADSTQWRLVEWRDIKGGGGVGASEAQTADGITPVVKTTWGALKWRCR